MSLDVQHRASQQSYAASQSHYSELAPGIPNELTQTSGRLAYGDGDDGESDFLSDESLRAITGRNDLSQVSYCELIVDTSEVSLFELGEKLPNLHELRVNSSVVPCIRDLGTKLKQLRILWISRSMLSDLGGCAALPELQELYASFNDVADCSPLAGCENLRCVDLESNRVEDLALVENFAFCAELHTLNLLGNPVSRGSRAKYRHEVAVAVPSLKTLDDEPVTDAERSESIAENEAEGEPSTTSNGGAETEDGDNAGDDELAALAAERDAAARELELVSDGIKYARVGFDDPNSWDVFGALPAAANTSSAPGTSHGGGMDRPRTAMVLPPRPGTAARILSTNFAAGGAGGPSALRPTTSYGFGPLARSRPGTSAGSRPGTAFATTSAPPSGTGGRNLYWRKHAIDFSVGGNRSAADEDEQAGESELTYGGDEVVGGNAAALLRRRRAAREESQQGDDNASASRNPSSDSLDHDSLLTELRNWKLETSRIVLMDEKDMDMMAHDILRGPSPPGTSGGGGEAEVLTLGDDNGEDVTEEDDGADEDEETESYPAPKIISSSMLSGDEQERVAAEPADADDSLEAAEAAAAAATSAAADDDDPDGLHSFHIPLEFRGHRPVGRLRPHHLGSDRPASRDGGAATS